MNTRDTDDDVTRLVRALISTLTVEDHPGGPSSNICEAGFAVAAALRAINETLANRNAVLPVDGAAATQEAPH
jgi:hypothetical protein